MASQHDTIGIRLSQMLRYFLSGERMSVNEFAKEFGVSLRTIQRDLNERLGFLPLQKDAQGKLFLPKESLSKVGFQDIRHFAMLSGIYGLYPSLEDQFLETLLHPKKSYFHQPYTYQSQVSESKPLDMRHSHIQHSSHSYMQSELETIPTPPPIFYF